VRAERPANPQPRHPTASLFRLGLPRFGEAPALRSDGAAIRLGFVEASGLPAPMLMVSMIGFGSLCHETGFSLLKALATTLSVWALPGQIAYVELLSAGSPAFALLFAVALANARFMPMVATFLPYIRPGLRSRAVEFALAHFVTANSWIFVIRRSPDLEPTRRWAYFVGFVGACLVLGLIGTALGYVLAGVVSKTVTQGLLFLNPIYFMLLFLEVPGRSALFAVLLGAVAGPLLSRLSSDWGLLGAGLLAGTVGFGLERALKARRG
jgi:predicted branched-subunit amino acid permease